MPYDISAIAEHDQYFGKPAVARRVHENRMELRTNVQHAHQIALGERDAKLPIHATKLVEFLGRDVRCGEDGGVTFHLFADVVQLAQVIATNLNHNGDALCPCFNEAALEKSLDRFANRSPAYSEACNQIAFRYLFTRSQDARKDVGNYA